MAIDPSKYSLRNVYAKARELFSDSAKGWQIAGNAAQNAYGNAWKADAAMRQSWRQQTGTNSPAEALGRSFMQVPQAMHKSLSGDRFNPVARASANYVRDFYTPMSNSFGNALQGGDLTTRPGVMNKVRGAAQIAKGFGQFQAAALPVTSMGITANSLLPQSPLKRAGTGLLRGYTQTDISPETQQQTINTPFGAIDPLMTAGNMVGFVKNPLNSSIFKGTEALLPTAPAGANASLKALNWVRNNAIRGGFENIILELPNLPENMSDAEKAKWVASTFGTGSISELVGQGILQGGGKATSKFTEKVVGDKDLARVFDYLKDQHRQWTIPVHREDGTTVPIWREWAGYQASKAMKAKAPGFIDPSAKVGGEAPKYRQTFNLNNPDDVEYLGRIFSKEQIDQFKAGNFEHWRGGGKQYFEDIAHGNIVSDPFTKQKLQYSQLNPGEIRQVFHGTAIENLPGIKEKGLLPGSTSGALKPGGGYGYTQSTISTSLDPKIAANFTGNSKYGAVIRLDVSDKAKIVSSKLDDAIELEQHLDQLKKEKVDAVFIGGGEKELVVINPKILTPQAKRVFETFQKAKNIESVPEEAFGVIAGLEPQFDEKGNFIGVKFNPAKAAAGVAVMGGLKTKQGKALTQAIDSKLGRAISSADPLEALKAEARKYKSAEEFVNAMGKKLSVDIEPPPPGSSYFEPGRREFLPGIGTKELDQVVAPYDKFNQPKGWATQLHELYTQATAPKVDTTKPVVKTGQTATAQPAIVDTSAQPVKTKAQVKGKDPVIRQINQLAESQKSLASSAPVQSSSVQGDGLQPPASSGSSGKIIPRSKKYAGSINKDNLQLTKEGKQILDQAVLEVKPQLEEIKGKPLTLDEVQTVAKESEMLSKVVTRDESLQLEAQLLNARKRLVDLDNQIAAGNTSPETLREFLEVLKVVDSTASNHGRQLGALRIMADDEGVRQQVMKRILRTNADTEKIIAEAGKVDWDNGNEVTAFYRKFIKPSAREILDEYRYNSILSNPLTHLRNHYSNTIQAFVTRPSTLLFEGRPKEAVKYFKGSLAAIPDAIDDYVAAFQGKKLIEKPDLDTIPTGKLPGVLTWPTREMEAGDKFYSRIIHGGELARGTDAQTAKEIAEYTLFRGDLSPKGQGYLLNKIDDATAGILSARRSIPGMDWFIPFVRTPMNFLKQTIEYSPAGITTIPGAANKRSQAAKAAVGSIPFLLGASLAMADRTTWSAPTDAKEKELFYASGKKPFSVRIGDAWVPMQYFGPFAWAVALPAATKYYQEDAKTALTDSQLQKLSKVTVSMVEYLSNQSFLEGMGNFVRFFSGDADYTMGKNLGFTASQMIPLSGLTRYIATVVDPVFRKATTFEDSIKSGIPFVSKTLKPYTEPNGDPSTRNITNYIAPYAMGFENEQYNQPLENRQNFLQKKNVITTKAKEIEKQAESGAVIPGAPVITEDDFALVNERMKIGDQTLTGDEIAAYYLKDVSLSPSGSKYQDAINDDALWEKINALNNSESLSEDQKARATAVMLDKAGIDAEDYQYYNVAKQENDLKTMYALEEITKVMTKPGATRDDLINWLKENRYEYRGKMVLSPGVIDNLVDEGVLSYQEGKDLKKYTFEKDAVTKQLKVKTSGKKKGTKAKVPKPKKIKLKKISVPKVKIVKSSGRSFKAPKVKNVDIRLRVKT